MGRGGRPIGAGRGGRALGLAGMVALSVPAPAWAQGAQGTGKAQEAQPQPLAQPQSPTQPAAEDDADEIIVRAGRALPGSVIGDIAPEVAFTPGDIRSFGVGSIDELIAEIAPQTGSGQGRGGESPVVLLNGRRVSSFAEIRDLPPEAIQRMEILPEEVGLKYGYSANQKVVNIVLRRRFRARTVQSEDAVPTAGGQFSPEADAGLFRIQGNSRLTVTGKYQRSSALTESERTIVPQTPRQPYAIPGNVTATTAGGAIDPALSALLGRSATVVGVPDAAATGPASLADFAGTGGQIVSDIGRYRTLLPQTDAATLNATLAQPIGSISATANTSFAYTGSDSLQGLATARLGVPAGDPFSPFAGATNVYRYLDGLDPLGQRQRDWSGHFGTTLNGMVGAWQWTFTGNYDHADSRTATDRGFDLTDLQARLDAGDAALNPFGPIGADLVGARLTDHARSIANSGDAQMLVTGSPLALPAGPVTTSVKLGGSFTALDARSTRAGIASAADLSRRAVSGQVSLDLPIASARKDVLRALGELSANFNLAYDGLSDFGVQRTIGAGLHWTPIRPVSLIASVSHDEGAPTVQQLGNPLVTTTGVRVFDYVRGQTVDITRLSGGNPALTADDRRVYKLGLTLKPFGALDLTLTANYTDSRVRNPIAAFPTATAAIEAAFPDRFTRDASGQLTQIDGRPINFAREDKQQLRWGINFSKQLKAPPRPTGQPSLRDLVPGAPGSPGQSQGQSARPGGGEGGPRGGGGPGGGGGFGGGGRFGGGGFGRGTRLQLAVYHTVQFRDDILAHEGGPRLDLLGGDAIGSSGGQPRHQLEAQAGLTRNGLGARASLAWQSATRVDGGLVGASTLRFSDLTTINLRLFADLGQLPNVGRKVPFLRGARITLAVTNLFDQRQHVRDTTGDTPISYQPDYLDPLGRSIKLTVRKLFF